MNSSHYLPYAGIGSRETPEWALDRMFTFGRVLARHGFTLRSGGAGGADTAFEQGAVSVSYNGAKAGTEIFLPWENFNRRRYGIVPFKYENENYPASELRNKAEEIAAKYHPAWNRCTPVARNMHVRNVAQVLGYDLESPSKFVICWTINGSGRGGTGQALRIAKAYGIPIFDMGSPDWDESKFDTFCEYLCNPEIADPQ